ncbi:MAG: transglutaminase family protein [Gammaproteobacteria bacterium]|nr:transglutaminase family protein [Gammaproteobacteria bacterium]
MKQYLENSEFIDWECPEIQKVAHDIKGDLDTDIEVAKACFEYVRDSIRHTWDFQIDVITCKASDVLNQKTGYCYAKSHLLAALLRANGIPVGLCYQRLSLTGDGAPYCLHGLNAIYLSEFGWYRVDPRGNKEGVEAKFTPPIEQLAFGTERRLETDIQGIWPEPLPIIVKALQQNQTCMAVYENLPDIEVYS